MRTRELSKMFEAFTCAATDYRYEALRVRNPDAWVRKVRRDLEQYAAKIQRRSETISGYIRTTHQ